jgi:hypothetical protein
VRGSVVEFDKALELDPQQKPCEFSYLYIYIDTCMEVTYLGMGFLVPTFMFQAVSCNLDMEAPVIHTRLITSLCNYSLSCDHLFLFSGTCFRLGLDLVFVKSEIIFLDRIAGSLCVVGVDLWQRGLSLYYLRRYSLSFFSYEDGSLTSFSLMPCGILQFVWPSMRTM